MRVLLIALLFAGHALAEVSSFLPAPPKPVAVDDTPLGLLDKDLRMDRNGWLDLLRSVQGARVTTIKQGNQVPCNEDIERRLKLEGYEIIGMGQLNVTLKEAPAKDELVRQAVDALQGYIDRKFAVHLLEPLYIAVAPNPALKKDELKRNLIEMLSGVASGNLGRVKAYIVREFDRPVSFVCVEIELGKGANFESIVRLVELSLGAFISNQAKEYEAEFEQVFGPAVRELQAEERLKPPEPKYPWGK